MPPKETFVRNDLYADKNQILVSRSAGDPQPISLPDDLVAQLSDPTQLRPSLGGLISLTEFEFEASGWATTSAAQKTATVAPAAIDTGGAVKLGNVNANQFTISPGIYLVMLAVQTDAGSAKTVEISVAGDNGSALITQNSMVLPGGGNKVAIYRTLQFGDDAIAGTLALKVNAPSPSVGMLVGGEITFTKVG